MKQQGVGRKMEQSQKVFSLRFLVLWIITSFAFNQLYANIGLYKRIDLSPNSVENCRMNIGDFNADGNIDFLFNDGRRVLKAFNHNGNLLWEKFNSNDPGVEEEHHNFKISVYDIDLDGKDEVICYLEINGENHLSIVDGESGDVQTSIKVPFDAPRDHGYWGLDNYYMQDHIAVANLRGLDTPQDILAIHASKLKVAAYYYNNDVLSFQWYWITDTDGYSSGHWAYPYDIDDDGKDEVIAGVDVLDENGNRLWQMDLGPFNPDRPDWGMDHLDAAVCADIHPGYPGKEIVAVAMTGIWMYKPDGTIIWNHPSKLTDPVNGYFAGEGIQEVLAGNFLPASPGLELVVYSEQMGGEESVGLFDKDGNVLEWGNQESGPRRYVTNTIDWDGDRGVDEIYSRTGIHAPDFQRISYSVNWGWLQTPGPDEFPPFVCDVQGDHREEILWYDTNEILIIYNSDPLGVPALPSPRTHLTYRVHCANNNHCNAYYLDWSSLETSSDQVPPLAPSNLICTKRTETSLTMQWDASGEASDGEYASYYRIFRNGVMISTTQSTSFADTDLRTNTPYNYQIYAVDSDDNQSVNATENSFETLMTFVPHDPSDPVDTPVLVGLAAQINVSDVSNQNNTVSIPITIITTQSIVQIPKLILVEKDQTTTTVELQGDVPGKVFQGTLLITDQICEGNATFRFLEDCIISVDGSVSQTISQGETIYIDKTPPSVPVPIEIIDND